MRGFPISAGDALQVSSWNALASVVLTIRGFTRTVDGGFSPFDFRHVPNTDRTIASTSHALPEGALVNVSVFVTGAAPIIGQTFVRLQLARGLGASAIILGTLAADYVTAVQPLAFPGSPVKRSVDGPGALRSITGTNPAAGAEISETVPTGARWRLSVFRALLATDGTVANRFPMLTIDDGATISWRADPNAAQVASISLNWVAGDVSVRSSPTVNTHTWHFPRRLILIAGSRIQTSTLTIQAGDDWGAPQLLVEEWLEGAA